MQVSRCRDGFAVGDTRDPRECWRACWGLMKWTVKNKKFGKIESNRSWSVGAMLKRKVSMMKKSDCYSEVSWLSGRMFCAESGSSCWAS